MAVAPHCVIRGCCSRREELSAVEFADYDPGWLPPTLDGRRVLTWCNSLRVTMPEGVGLFCPDHLEAAVKLRHLPALEAVAELMLADRRGRGDA
jgi:hypothetical protein